MSLKIPEKYKIWIEAGKKFNLSHKHIQMARELKMNPKKLGSIANHKQQRWKTPLPEFIEDCYMRRFNKSEPNNITSIVQIVKNNTLKKTLKKEAKLKINE